MNSVYRLMMMLINSGIKNMDNNKSYFTHPIVFSPYLNTTGYNILVKIENDIK